MLQRVMHVQTQQSCSTDALPEMRLGYQGWYMTSRRRRTAAPAAYLGCGPR